MSGPRQPLLASVALCLALACSAASADEPDRPFRLEEALGGPAWLRFSLEHRARFEHLEHDFRAASPGSWSAAMLRTLAALEVELAPLALGVELMDARAFATPGTPLNTTLANPLDLLQAYGRLRHRGLFFADDTATLTFGRLTLDLGSRRTVARNDFRNTINAFTGLELRWATASGHALRAFAVVPVVRRPDLQQALEEHRLEADRENLDALLFGAHFGTAPLGPDLRVEAWALGFLERDGPVAASADRRLLTLGLRALRPPARGRLDFQGEGALQAGTSRASTRPSDTRDLEHLAGTAHVSAGFTLPLPASPRLSGFYDWASGDADPADASNHRYDPLYGARRFDFGPTGLYGAVSRSNLSSPGARLEAAPHPRLDGFVGYRAVWLASARDAWAAAGLWDRAGASGTFVGHQVEGRARWHVLPRNLALEVGAAHLARGDFARAAPGGRSEPSTLLYAQLTGTL